MAMGDGGGQNPNGCGSAGTGILSVLESAFGKSSISSGDKCTVILCIQTPVDASGFLIPPPPVKKC